MSASLTLRPSKTFGLQQGLLLAIVLTQTCSCQSNVTNSMEIDATPNSHLTLLESPAEKGTSQIYVTINLVPYISHFGAAYVAANTQLNISAILMDSDYNVSRLMFEWTTKDGAIKLEPHAKDIFYIFTKSDEDNFVNVTVSDPATNATGSARFDVTVKSPVVVTDPIGKLFLERGELLNISLRYSGSAPFTYCWKFCTPYDILPCDFCFPPYQTTSTTIPIIHYFHQVGNYTLMFQIENTLNKDVKHYTIKINDTVRRSNLPIAPIVSTILAVIILISGVALHLKFRDSSYLTETANFDFFNTNEDEDWEQEFSFIQRVKYLFCGISDQDEEEEARYLLRKGSAASSTSSGHGTNTTTTTTAPGEAP